MTRKPPTKRTPAERAQETVDVLQRRLARIEDRHGDLNAQLMDLAADIEATEKRLAYAQANPDLPAQEPVDE